MKELTIDEEILVAGGMIAAPSGWTVAVTGSPSGRETDDSHMDDYV